MFSFWFANKQEFWSYLVDNFGETRAQNFLPKLARLIADDDKRRALLRCPKQRLPLAVSSLFVKIKPQGCKRLSLSPPPPPLPLSNLN